MRVVRRKLGGGQRGNAAVETAFVAILFVMLLFGVVGFGRVIWAHAWVSHAAREGSRYASVRGKVCGNSTQASAMNCPASATSITQYLKDSAPWFAGEFGTNITVNVAYADSEMNQGTAVTVTVSYNVKRLVPFVPDINVASTSKMIIAQ